MTEQESQSVIDRLTEALRKAREGDCTLLLEVADGGDDIDALSREVRLLVESMRGHADARAVAEAELRECRESCRRLKANIPGMVYLFALHPDGTFSFPSVSDASGELFAIAPHELMADVGLLTRLIHPDDRDRFFASVRRSAETLAPWREEIRHIVHGEVRWYDCISRPERHANGDIVWDGIILEITGRKRAEERLSEQLHFLQQLLDTIPLPVFYKDTDGVYLGCNSAFELFCGFSRERIVGRTVHDLAPSQRADVYQEADAALFDAPGVQVYEAEFQNRDGSTRDVIFNKATFVDPENRVAGLVGAITDISGRRRAERELLLKNDMLRAIIQAAPTAIIGLDLDGNVCNVWNPAAERMLGWSAAEVMGKPLPGMDPEQREEFRDFQEWIRGGRILDGVEVRRHRQDGSPMDCSIYASPLHDTEGRIVGSIAVLVDITERKQVEESLRLANLIVENSPLVLFRWRATEGWPVELVSRNVTRFGYTPDELITGVVPFSALVHPDDLRQVAAEVAEFVRQGVDRFQQEYRIVTKGGAVRWIDDRSAVERDSQGRISHFQGVVLDITERKLAEEKIRAALTEKVVLLKEIHHRVKNNLQIISTLLDLQAESVRDEGALCAFRESQDRIRAMALVHEKLYRTEDLSFIDFSGYIESLTAHLYNSYAIDFGRVSFSIDAGNVCLSIDQAIPCGLIISELVSNSLKYAFPGSAAGNISVSIREQGDGMVSLTVADSGVGLPVNLDFTASETLGLQLVRMLVKQLRGEIALDSSGGARFSIRFPMSPAG
ncbi:PAS domain S-box protein [Pelobacter propionicus]|uniref:Signal transduction histidine kinase n=1 Tax=Pelobacter propionicus (strain DSM 2379 / NBRC 103807 / OttBd1) TaxID=338966 RepID=A1ATD6_PELPD|nr:PAS domain S-box protein [Pelobacter propionicus]ABL00607.1 signal transduction histidine kinase [Pelobacter propionicus DSM 2379]